MISTKLHLPRINVVWMGYTMAEMRLVTEAVRPTMTQIVKATTMEMVRSTLKIGIAADLGTKIGRTIDHGKEVMSGHHKSVGRH